MTVRLSSSHAASLRSRKALFLRPFSCYNLDYSFILYGNEGEE